LGENLKGFAALWLRGEFLFAKAQWRHFEFLGKTILAAQLRDSQKSDVPTAPGQESLFGFLKF
jgi:hypothetical protein